MLIPADEIVEIKCPQTNNKWEKVSIWQHPRIIDDWENPRLGDGSLQKIEEYKIETFEELLHFPILNKTIDKTIFGKTYVKVKSEIDDIKLTQRNFKELFIRTRYELHNEWTFEFLMKALPYQDFIKFVKANNLC